MSQAAKAQEPSMEEILASIRRIIADDEAGSPAARPADAAAAGPRPVALVSNPPAAAAPPPEPQAMNQDDIDAMLAGFEAEAKEPEAQALSEEPDDVLELTSAMEARSEPPPGAGLRVDPALDVVFSEARSEPRPQPEPELSQPAQHDERPPLLSQHATAAVTSAFGTLAHTVLAQNARTLEDLVREMLRPMLKTWLDDNLPNIVERLVRAEIERVSRGGG
jgi:cell pole-organizing protein PopZ